VLFFSYEEFTEKKAVAVQRLQLFLPDIGHLNWQRAYESQSVFGPIEWKISNLNDVKISRLSTDDISAVNSVLQSDPSLLNHFNYNFLDGGTRHDLWRLRAQAKLRIIETWERAKRVYKRRLNGTPGDAPDR